jgi:two-component flavin-dependent monooxygenase
MTATAERLHTDHAADLAGKGAMGADRTGRLAQEVIDALAAAGFARHFVPARWGGTDGTFGDLTGAVLTVGRGCASAGWCASLLAHSGRLAAFLPDQAQREIWGSDADTLWAAGLVPSGRVEAVDGGFRVSGRWSYISGAEFADWALLAGPQPSPQGTAAPQFLAVPRGDFTVEETWNAVGMRATGSHTVVLDRVSVPGHRAVPMAEVAGGLNLTSTRPAHTVPLVAAGGLAFLAPALGAASGALSACLATVGGKRPGPPGSATGSRDVPVAHAAAEIEAATLLVERVAGVLDAGQGRQHAIRNARDCAYAAELVTSSVNDLMRAAGTAAQDQSSPLQRIWRDITVATSHAALRFDRPASAYTEALLERGEQHDREAS